MDLTINTKLAWRALTAVLVSTAVGEYFQLPYNFWAVFIAFVLIAPTIGEGVFLATARIITTIVGCFIASLLFLTWSAPLWLELVATFIGLFFFVAYTRIRIWTSMLALGFTVGALFSILNRWSWHIYEVRIYETMIGGAIAIVVNSLMWPLLAKKQLVLSQNKIQDLFSQLYAMLSAEYSNELIKQARLQTHQIVLELTQYEKLMRFSRYELFFKYRTTEKPEKTYEYLVDLQEVSGHLLDTFILVQRQPYFHSLRGLINASIVAVQKAMAGHEIAVQPIIDSWSEQFHSSLKAYSLDELQVFVQLYFYFRRILELVGNRVCSSALLRAERSNPLRS